jgi:hypothetical protein
MFGIDLHKIVPFGTFWLKCKKQQVVFYISIKKEGVFCVSFRLNIEDPVFEPKPQEVTPFKIVTLQRNGDISTFCPELAGGTKDNSALFSIGNISSVTNLEDVTKNENFLKIVGILVIIFNYAVVALPLLKCMKIIRSRAPRLNIVCCIARL